MIKLDGSFGEGGGAILRQAMALSTLTGKPFEINNIRSGRPKPGLKAQHMHSIIALEKLSGCSVTGVEIGSRKLTFIPGTVKSGTVNVEVGTAGSITLLLQALILPIIMSGEKVTLNLTGGTDVKWSQPIDYFANVLVPALKKYASIEVQTKLRGYYPKGGGKVSVKIKSSAGIESLNKISLMSRGQLLQIRGVSHASSDLAKSEVADRQARNAEILLSDLKVPVQIERQYSSTASTGSGISLWALFSYGTEDFAPPIILGSDALGDRGVKSEEVGRKAVESLKREINSEACVDKFLADQLIPLLGIIKGEIRTSEITGHAKSNIYIAEKFLDTKFETEGNVIRAL